jgi:hypothetical protein
MRYDDLPDGFSLDPAPKSDGNLPDGFTVDPVPSSRLPEGFTVDAAPPVPQAQPSPMILATPSIPAPASPSPVVPMPPNIRKAMSDSYLNEIHPVENKPLWQVEADKQISQWGLTGKPAMAKVYDHWQSRAQALQDYSQYQQAGKAYGSSGLVNNAMVSYGNSQLGTVGGAMVAASKLIPGGSGVTEFLQGGLRATQNNAAPDTVLNTVAGGVGSAIPFIAATLAGGPVAAGAMGGASGFGSQYTEAKDYGADEKTALASGAIGGAIEGATEYVGGKFLPGATKYTGKIAQRFGLPAAKTAGERFVTGLAGNLTENMIEEGMAQAGQDATAKALYDPTRSVTAGIPNAMIGGLGGGLVGSPVIAGQAVRDQAYSDLRTNARALKDSPIGSDARVSVQEPQGPGWSSAKYVAKTFGVNLVPVEMANGRANAFFDRDSQTVFANRATPNDAITAVLFHEVFGHAQKSPEVAAMVDKLRADNPDLQRMAEQLSQNDRRAAGVGETTNPTEEGTALIIETAIRGDKNAQNVVAQQQPGLIRSVLTGMIDAADRFASGNKAKARMVEKQKALWQSVLTNLDKADAKIRQRFEGMVKKPITPVQQPSEPVTTPAPQPVPTLPAMQTPKPTQNPADLQTAFNGVMAKPADQVVDANKMVEKDATAPAVEANPVPEGKANPQSETPESSPIAKPAQTPRTSPATESPQPKVEPAVAAEKTADIQSPKAGAVQTPAAPAAPDPLLNNILKSVSKAAASTETKRYVYPGKSGWRMSKSKPEGDHYRVDPSGKITVVGQPVAGNAPKVVRKPADPAGLTANRQTLEKQLRAEVATSNEHHQALLDENTNHKMGDVSIAAKVLKGTLGPESLVTLEDAKRLAAELPDEHKAKIILHNLAELEKNPRGTKVESVNTNDVADGTQVVMNDKETMEVDHSNGMLRDGIDVPIPADGVTLVGKKIVKPVKGDVPKGDFVTEDGKNTGYPPLHLPEHGVNRGEIAKQYGLPADLYTNGTYLTERYNKADARLTAVQKGRLGQQSRKAAEAELNAAWKEVVDKVRANGSAPAKSSMQKDMFGNSFIDSSGIGEQMPMFHEPTEGPKAAKSDVKGSKNALDPKNTSDLPFSVKASSDIIKDQEAVKSLNDSWERRANDYGIKYQPFEYLPPGKRADYVSDGDARRIEEIAGKFGKKITWINGATRFGGAALLEKEMGGRILINASAEHPHLALLGHELIHWMSRENPALFDSMQRGMDSYLHNTEGEAAYLIRSGYRPGEANEEITANISGDRFLEPKFWRMVADANPGKWSAIRNNIIQFITKTLNRIKDVYGSSRIISDIEGVRRLVARTMADYAESSTPKVKKNHETPYSVKPSDEAGSQRQPIETPELLQLAKELVGDVNVKKLRSARGVFRPGFDAKTSSIEIDPKTFETPEQAAKTIAHEIGHAADFIPDNTMTRRTIRNRIASLTKAVEEVLQGMPAEGVYRKELLALTEWWRGPIPTNDANYAKYRKSGKELYADAISVLMNDPAELSKRAPEFNKAFFEKLDRKPAVKEAYEGIQSLLSMGKGAVGMNREAIRMEGYDAAEAKWKQANKDKARQGEGILSNIYSLIASAKRRVVAKQANAVGKDSPEAHQFQNMLDELDYADNRNALYVRDVHEQVEKPLKTAGVDNKQLGDYLFLKRVAEGDRGGQAEATRQQLMELSGETTWEKAKEWAVKQINDAGKEGNQGDVSELADSLQSAGVDPEELKALVAKAGGIANPYGETPATARDGLAFKEKTLGPEKWKALESAAKRFHELTWKSVEDAYKQGIYSEKQFKELLEPNKDHYATFAVTHYLQSRIASGIKQQVGTFHDVADPFTATVMKTGTLNRRIEIERAKQGFVKEWAKLYPQELGEKKYIDQFHHPDENGMRERGKEMLTFMEDGKLAYHEVDPYIARVFSNTRVGTLNALAALQTKGVHMVFHPLFIGMNLGWQIANPIRDTMRNYKNISMARGWAGESKLSQAVNAVLDAGRVLYHTATAIPTSINAAWNKLTPETRGMLERSELGTGFWSEMRENTKTQYDKIIESYGFEGANGRRKIVKVLSDIYQTIERIGEVGEFAGKIGAKRAIDKMNLTQAQKSLFIRDYAGTPNTREKGTATNLSNGLFMYSNVAIQGWRADAYAMSRPKSAMGYALRFMLVAGLPKLAMVAAAKGLFGDDAKEEMDQVSEYLKTKYTIIPMGMATDEAGGKTSRFIALPTDESSRLPVGIMWKLLNQRPASEIMGLLGSEIPGVNPVIGSGLKVAQALAGGNPTDSFRDRPIIPATEYAAGGIHEVAPMGKYLLRQTGVAGDVLLRFVGDEVQVKLAGKDAVVQSVPGLSRLVRYSDRGIIEKEFEDKAKTEQADAIQKLESTTAADRKKAGIFNMLNRIGYKNLTDQQKAKRNEMAVWYNMEYLPKFKDPEIATEIRKRIPFNQLREYYASLTKVNAYEQAKSGLANRTMNRSEALTQMRNNRPTGRELAINRSVSRRISVIRKRTKRRLVA